MADDDDDPRPASPKKRGRPRAADPGVKVSTWISTREYDKLARQARHRDESLSSIIRRKVVEPPPKS